MSTQMVRNSYLKNPFAAGFKAMVQIIVPIYGYNIELIISTLKRCESIFIPFYSSMLYLIYQIIEEALTIMHVIAKSIHVLDYDNECTITRTIDDDFDGYIYHLIFQMDLTLGIFVSIAQEH